MKNNTKPLPLGFELHGVYVIRTVLDSDDLSVTYLADHKQLRNKQVIQEYLPPLCQRLDNQKVTVNSNSENYKWGLNRFIEEAQLLHKLSHTNIIKVSDVFEANGTAYYVTPYYGRQSLKTWLDMPSNLNIDKVNQFFLPILDGLKYIHKHGLIHGNISPDSILISGKDTPVLRGFTNAYNDIANGCEGVKKRLTSPYAPIELYDNTLASTIEADLLDVRADLYGLSACMYQILAGKPIPNAPDRAVNDTFEPLSTNQGLLSKYPKNLLSIVDKNLSLYPKDRQASATEMYDALTMFQGRNESNTTKQSITKPVTTSSESLPSEPIPSKSMPFVSEPSHVKSTQAQPVTQSQQVVHSPESEKKSKKVVLALLALLFVGGGLFVANTFLEGTDDNGQKPNSADIATGSIPAVISEGSNNNTSQGLDATAFDGVEMALNIQGSNTIGAELMPKLLSGYYSREGKSEVGIHEVGLDDKKFLFKDNSQSFAIDLGSHGSSTGLKALIDEEAGLAMSSRKVKPKEVKEIADKGLGDIQSEAQELVIGLDGIAIIVNKANPITSLTTAQLKDIFTGKVSNWSQVGGSDSPINLYIRDDNSGTRDTFDSLIMGEEKLASAKDFEDSEQLSDTVSEDISGIGYIGLPYIKNAKAIAVAASNESTALMPTSFTIATEDYPLSRRLYLYLPKEPNKDAQGLANFALSKEGQKIVHDIGFIDITPELAKMETASCDASLNTGYKTLCNNGERLNANFRFEFGSSVLDNKAKQSLRRVAERLNEAKQLDSSVRFALVGFTDNKGKDCVNNRLSVSRANIVANELATYGVKPDIIEGMGADAPVGDNNTDTGREKNRRVELWTIPSDVSVNFPPKNQC